MTSNYLPGNSFPEAPLSDILKKASMIDGIDVQLALSYISGKQYILEETMKQTVFNIDNRIKKMRACLSNQDLDGFSIDAHGLKSELAYIGAAEYSQLASELEIISRANNMVLCQDKFSVFSGFVEKLSVSLKSIFPKDEEVEKRAGDSELILKCAKEAVEFLEMYEADDALSCMGKLSEFTFGDETDALIKYICDKVRNYKYDEAIIHLKGILGIG